MFQLSGFRFGALIVPDPVLRSRVRQSLNADGTMSPAIFALEAGNAACPEGAQWVDTLRNHLGGNRQLVGRFLDQELKQISLASSQTPRSAWLDSLGVSWNASDMAQYIRVEAVLCLPAGDRYRGNGQGFLELNRACPRQMLTGALRRLKAGVSAYEDYTAAMC